MTDEEKIGLFRRGYRCMMVFRLEADDIAEKLDIVIFRASREELIVIHDLLMEARAKRAASMAHVGLRFPSLGSGRYINGT